METLSSGTGRHPTAIPVASVLPPPGRSRPFSLHAQDLARPLLMGPPDAPCLPLWGPTPGSPGPSQASPSVSPRALWGRTTCAGGTSECPLPCWELSVWGLHRPGQDAVFGRGH